MTHQHEHDEHNDKDDQDNDKDDQHKDKDDKDKDDQHKDQTGHMCACGCHGEVKVHVTVTCDCGRPVKPPRRTVCPPPPSVPQPGTVDVPQQTPPYKPGTSSTPPWRQGRPKPGDPNEIPWFRGQIGTIRRKGPTFGPRKDEYLPYLLVRATSGDRGQRPFNGVFWESPDIYVAPNLEASTAPLQPPTSAGIARANAPNTLYAHIWNLGKAPAFRVRVEFYWFNPSLGFSGASAHLIGAAWIDLANRLTLYSNWQVVDQPYGRYLSRGCHAIVRCPETWVPTFENNGHECLVVRVSEPMFDPVPVDHFSPANDRHVGQRNIAVVQAASPAVIDLALDLGYAEAPGDAVVDMELVAPGAMEWLQLLMGRRDPGLAPPTTPIVAGFLPPTIAGTRVPPFQDLPFDCRAALLLPRERFQRGCDPLRIAFHASAADLEHGQAQILRIRQRADNAVIGGYSVVLLRT